MQIEYEYLIRSIDETIKSYKEKYTVDQWQIFFSSEEDTQLFCNRNIELLNIFKTLNIKEIKQLAKKKANSDIQAKIPYVIATETIISFKKTLLEKLFQYPSSDMAQKFYTMINAAENCIAQTYLNFELDKLVTFNEIRMKSIRRLPNNTTLYLYESHLLWLDQLISALRNIDSSKMPELHPEKCILGEWLALDAKEIITDKIVLDEFIALHKNLHFIGKKIELCFLNKPIDFQILMLLLKKVELLSLSIGVELSIINNIRFQASASKDTLTGALNRQLLFHIFSTQFEISRAVEKSFCVIMADLDDFKNINDSHGHVEGDKVLRSFCKMITNTLRESDFVIRFGGEEFLLILPTTELDNAVRIAEKLRYSTHLLQKQDDFAQGITASFGVIEINADAELEIDETLMSSYIQKVDKELYHAKKNGKDQVSSPKHNLKEPLYFI